jgi:hypothetical protein
MMAWALRERSPSEAVGFELRVGEDTGRGPGEQSPSGTRGGKIQREENIEG